jgi:hypothetical protein
MLRAGIRVAVVGSWSRSSISRGLGVARLPGDEAGDGLAGPPRPSFPIVADVAGRYWSWRWRSS